MAKKVTYATLFSDFYLPAIGQMKTSLPPDNKSLPNFRMTLQDNGTLLLEWDASPKISKGSYTVGASNIKGCYHAHEKDS